MILVMDTSRKGVMLGIYDLASYAPVAEFADSKAKGDQLGKILDELLSKAGVNLKDIEKVLVTLGPGSFTGIRTGVAFAQGLCFAGGRTLHGVSTLRALRTHLAEGSDAAVVLRARKGFDYVGTLSGEALVEGNREDTAEDWAIAPFARLVDEVPASLVQEANYLQASYAERGH
jgi:tRNA threonylcarbamoyladenosine biosynthesis protein TsaB